MNVPLLFVWFIGKKLSDGEALSEKGKLKLAWIDTFQSFYGLAQGENKVKKKCQEQPTLPGPLVGKCYPWKMFIKVKVHGVVSIGIKPLKKAVIYLSNIQFWNQFLTNLEVKGF